MLLPLLTITLDTGLRAAEIRSLRRRLFMIDENETDMREGEKLLHYCLDWARKRQAELHELQATQGLVQVMVRTGRREEGRTMLAEIYNWFTEGLDTEPLTDAKALLDELS